MNFLFKNYECESFNFIETVEKVELVLFIFLSFEGFAIQWSQTKMMQTPTGEAHGHTSYMLDWDQPTMWQSGVQTRDKRSQQMSSVDLVVSKVVINKYSTWSRPQMSHFTIMFSPMFSVLNLQALGNLGRNYLKRETTIWGQC